MQVYILEKSDQAKTGKLLLHFFDVDIMHQWLLTFDRHDVVSEEELQG